MGTAATIIAIIAGVGLGGKALDVARKKIGYACPDLDLLTDKEKIQKNLEDNLRDSNPEIAARNEKIQQMLKPAREMKNYSFREMAIGQNGKYSQTGQRRTFSLIRANDFDEKKDALIHGIIKTVDDKGVVHAEDIYVYQPRVYGKNDQLIGPRFTTKTKKTTKQEGNILKEYTYETKSIDQTPYACKVDGKLYTGYIPKREVASNMIMDFDIKSPYAFEDRFPDLSGKSKNEISNQSQIQRFIQVSYDKDENGNFKTVDLLDPEEEKKFKSYIEKHSKINSISYYMSKIRNAQNLLIKFLAEHKEANVKGYDFGAEDLMKVENKRQADQDKLIEKMNQLATIQYNEARYGIRPYGSEPNGRPMGGGMGMPGNMPMGPNPSGPMNPYNPVGQMNMGNMMEDGGRHL